MVVSNLGNRTKGGVHRHWDIRLTSIGLVGALAGSLYSMFPFAGGSNTPDEYLLMINAEIHDVELPTKEFLEQTRAASRARRAEAQALNVTGIPADTADMVHSVVPRQEPSQSALPPPITPPPAPPATALPSILQ
jgi:hypothetical protein